MISVAKIILDFVAMTNPEILFWTAIGPALMEAVKFVYHYPASEQKKLGPSEREVLGKHRAVTASPPPQDLLDHQEAAESPNEPAIKQKANRRVINTFMQKEHNDKNVRERPNQKSGNFRTETPKNANFTKETC